MKLVKKIILSSVLVLGFSTPSQAGLLDDFIISIFSGTNVPDPKAQDSGTNVPDPNSQRSGTNVPDPKSQRSGTNVPDPK